MNDRFLTFLNLGLLGVCGFCLWFLATVDYQQPAEIRQALDVLKDHSVDTTTDTRFNPDTGLVETVYVAVSTPVPAPPQPPKSFPGLEVEFTKPLYTPTPSPTPTPTPTPEPANLASAVASWTLVGITDEKTVELQETRPEAMETFTLTVGGPPHMAKDAGGLDVEVRLISVDLDNYRVKLGFLDQTEEKAM